ncbi:DUF3422 family protein [Noviherbaspirillum aridicola]|uniref:Membrane-anchored protein n=1 Tax=Noviherbaspirillum aridicola TaxID=2849687 RepID=A0ABQ4QA82_9BURK|nr:DUF3422 domain-containing protein [Noviherbaspirillum aridicola]GIZ53972.1 hypothetical protein NCCP691_39860 [Noviherbaspirillum aridicola]
MTIATSRLNHPLRIPLAAEVHSRPFMFLGAPEAITHLAVYMGEGGEPSPGGANDQHALLAGLCAHFGVAPPSAEARYFFHEFGRFRLKWECHTEFATYTFAARQERGTAVGDAFAGVPLQLIPQDWLLSLQGKLMVGAHLYLDTSGLPSPDYAAQARSVFEGRLLAGSRVLNGGEIWTDFLVQSDGFSRFLVRDTGLQEQQAGRLVQRVLEIETYRMMALLGFPRAQRAIPQLNGIEDELETLTSAMVDTDGKPQLGDDQADAEQALLNMITRLAARTEKLALENSYRFSASQAYFKLVQARIEELRETRIEGFPTVEEFMERRLAPAMHTCQAVSRRQEILAERIARTNDLLRTRVGITQERQNRRILESLNARAAQQLRLQQAVEGLSVVAISYYLTGLLGYAIKAAKVAGLPLNPELATGLVLPFVAAGVWLGLRRMRGRLHAGHG